MTPDLTLGLSSISLRVKILLGLSSHETLEKLQIQPDYSFRLRDPV